MTRYFLSGVYEKNEYSSSDVDDVNISWDSSSDIECEAITQHSNVVKKLNFDDYENFDIFFNVEKNKESNDSELLISNKNSVVKSKGTNNFGLKEQTECEDGRFTISEVTSPELNSKNSRRRVYNNRSDIRKRDKKTKSSHQFHISRVSCKSLFHNSPNLNSQNDKLVITEIESSPESKTKLTDCEFIPELITSKKHDNDYYNSSPQLGSKHTGQEKNLKFKLAKENNVLELKYESLSNFKLCEVNGHEMDNNNVKSNIFSETDVEANNIKCNSHMIQGGNFSVMYEENNTTARETVNKAKSHELKCRPKIIQNIVSAQQEGAAVSVAASPELGHKHSAYTIATGNVNHSEHAPSKIMFPTTKICNISSDINDWENTELNIYTASKENIFANSLKILRDNIFENITHADAGEGFKISVKHENKRNKNDYANISDAGNFNQFSISESPVLFSKQKRLSSGSDKSAVKMNKHKDLVENSRKLGDLQYALSHVESSNMNNVEPWQNVECKRLKLQDYVMKLVNTPSREKARKTKACQKQSTKIFDSNSPVLSYDSVSTPNTCSGSSLPLSCRRKLTELINVVESKAGNICVKNADKIKCCDTIYQKEFVKHLNDDFGKERSVIINKSSHIDPSFNKCNKPPMCVDGEGNNLSEFNDLIHKTMMCPLSSEPSVIESVSSQEFRSSVQEDSGSSSYTKHISPVCTQQMVQNKEGSSQDTSSSTSSSLKPCENNCIVDLDSAKKKRKRWKKNSLGGRLQKLLSRQKSLANILQYESNLLAECTTVSRRKKNALFTVQQCSMEFGRLIVYCCLCSTTENNGSKLDSSIEDDIGKNIELTSSGTKITSSRSDVILLLNPDTVKLPKLQKSSILNTFPPWEVITIPGSDVKVILSITHIEVIHIASVVSSISPVQYARVLKQYSCACIKAHHCVKGCLFQLSNNGYEIMKEIIFDLKCDEVCNNHAVQILPTQPIKKLIGKDEGTIISAVNCHSRVSASSFFLKVMVDKVFCYRHAAITLNSIPLTQGECSSFVWSVLCHDLNGEYCEIILGPCSSHDSFIVPNTTDNGDSQSQPLRPFCDIADNNISDIRSCSTTDCNCLFTNENTVENENVSVNTSKFNVKANGSKKYCFKISKNSIGKLLRFNGFTLTKRLPYSIVSGFFPFINKDKILCTSKDFKMEKSPSQNVKLLDSTKHNINKNEATEDNTRQFLYIFSPASDIWCVTEECTSGNWIVPQDTSVIDLSEALTQCQNNRYLRFSVLCVLIQFFDNSIYVTDDSLTSGYVCITVRSLCYIPQKVETNSTRIILLQDILGHNGSILADKYSSVISYDKCNVQKIMLENEEKLDSLQKLKFKIPLFDPTAVEKSLVQLSGNIVGLDEDTAYEWAECKKCGMEILEELHRPMYFCKRCMEMVETFTKRSLVVTMTSNNLPSHYNIKVKLLQNSINKLLGAPSPNHNEYDPISYLGQEFGPLMCLVLKSQKFQNYRNSLYLQEVSPAGENN